jgi:hypothetical protein
MIEYLLDMNDVTNYNKDVLLNVKEIFLKSGYEDI